VQSDKIGPVMGKMTVDAMEFQNFGQGVASEAEGSPHKSYQSATFGPCCSAAIYRTGFQEESILKSVICCARSAVFSPKSFW